MANLPTVNGKFAANLGFWGLEHGHRRVSLRITRVSFAAPGLGLPKFVGKLRLMANDTDTEALRRLGDVVLRRRREELRISQYEVGERGGPSTSTLTKIEAGLPPVPSPATLRKLDDGLGWTDGSAYRLLHQGTDPEPRTVSAATRLQSVPELPRVKGGPLRRLLDIRRELDEVIEELRSE